MLRIFGGLCAVVAMTGSAMAGVRVPVEVSEAGPLGLIALGIVGVAIAYRLRNRK